MISNKYRDFLHLVVYQIYPRSFYDGNNDGIGDIKGIISKLDYLKELGINAIWMSPCYKSPGDDNGYDISDYRDIDPMFGTLDDMKELIAEMHKRGIKLIMDLVANHTSSQHKWFVESRKSRDNKYSDYYYWFDEKPNDWRAAFGGGCWEWVPERQQYYLHSFCISQPDLNWDNPAVVKEMQDVVDYWVKLGVDGFRCDVIDRISKDIKHDVQAYGPRLREYIGDLFGRPETEHIFTVGECWCSDINKMVEHSAYESKELSTLFQFDHCNVGRADKFTPKQDKLSSMRNIIVRWENLTQQNDLIYTLFCDNHDQNRLLSRIGNDKEQRYETATCIAAVLYGMRGVPFIYEGQEFGMTGSYHTSIDEFDDCEGINEYNEMIKRMPVSEAIEKLNFGCRDNPRRPVAWDDSEYAGFSKHEPWLSTYSRYKEINLKKDLASEKSVFRFYKDLLNLRNTTPAMTEGDYACVSTNDDDYYIYTRSHGEQKVTVICNFEQESKIDYQPEGKLVLKNYADVAEVYRPYEVRIFIK